MLMFNSSHVTNPQKIKKKKQEEEDISRRGMQSSSCYQTCPWCSAIWRKDLKRKTETTKKQNLSEKLRELFY